MLELFEKGGIMMYPLLLCSVLAVAIMLERFWNLRRKRILVPEIIGMLDRIEKPEDLSLANSICEKFDSPFSRIIRCTIANRSLSHEDLRTTVEDEGRQEVRTLHRGLSALETIANIAPLLGLLGTVLGMIKVFNIIQTLGVGQAKALSGGISEALITTAAGLFIGIPAVFLYNYFNTRVENLILDIEQYTLMLLNKMIRMNRATAPTLEPDSLKLNAK